MLNGYEIAERVHMAIWHFGVQYGIKPNRIILGYNFAKEVFFKWFVAIGYLYEYEEYNDDF